MINTEFYRIREDGVNLFRTYSDIGMHIVDETGALYSEAVNVEGSTHTYIETDIPIVEPEE